MCIFKKKVKIEKIETLSVSSEQLQTYEGGFVQSYTLHLNPSLTDNAKKDLKPVIENCILTVAETLDVNCYWMVCAYDFLPFSTDDPVQISEMIAYFKSLDPAFCCIVLDEWHIFLLLNQMNEQILSLLKNADLPNMGSLPLDVFHASFTAFQTKNIDEIIKQISVHGIGVDEAGEICSGEKIKFDMIYIDSRGAKTHVLSLGYEPQKNYDVKDAMVSVFEKYKIQLVFLDDIES